MRPLSRQDRDTGEAFMHKNWPDGKCPKCREATLHLKNGLYEVEGTLGIKNEVEGTRNLVVSCDKCGYIGHQVHSVYTVKRH